MLSVRDLELIAAIESSGTLTAAADRLGTSQPALSRSLGQLERRLGVALFVRSARGMIPTLPGAQLAERGRAVTAVTARARRDLAGWAQGQSGELRLGIVPHLSVESVTTAVARMRSDHPRIRIRVRVGATSELIDELRIGELDLVLTPPPAPEPELVFVPLFRDRTAIITATTAPAEPPSPAWLRAQPWVLAPRGTPTTNAVNGYFFAAGLEPPLPVVETSDPLLTVGLVTGGHLGALPANAARTAAALGMVRPMELDLSDGGSIVGALRARAADGSPHIDTFLRLLDVHGIEAQDGPGYRGDHSSG